MTAHEDARARFHLAQFNVARLRYPLDDPRTADFVAQLDPVNALADGAPGFVWRLVEDGQPDATRMRPAGDDVIITFSVWESQEALWDFVYRSTHLATMRRRREWFHRHAEAHMVMWWIPAGYLPTVEEALERLELLRSQGPSPRAFTFSASYTAEEAAEAEQAEAEQAEAEPAA
jgi:heme-degrading monooxygenase HmoA